MTSPILPSFYFLVIKGLANVLYSYHDEVEIQKSFLDAFLKGEDTYGWSTPGKVPPVTITLRKGNVGFNNALAESAYTKRTETAWPLPHTQYTKYFLTSEKELSTTPSVEPEEVKLTYHALGSIDNFQGLRFETKPFEKQTEITGHVTAHLNVSMTPDSSEDDGLDKDIDLFLTLRHFDPSGEEVLYTGTAGDGVPLTKGWLRCSMRKVHETNPRHRSYLMHREYLSTDVEQVKAREVYAVDIEIWPTNVVVEKGGKIMIEVASGDTQGCGVFQHCSEVDRPRWKFMGHNHVHFGSGLENYVTLPIINTE